MPRGDEGVTLSYARFQALPKDMKEYIETLAEQLRVGVRYKQRNENKPEQFGIKSAIELAMALADMFEAWPQKEM